ncbi:TonB-dependent receptor [Pedobacter nyackensis]|uniref:TonB-dependent receptor n=1 Tax=Pedobacter nyackensis TaxID=475255 RepID=UPI00292F4A93|nr:TonB-dependent receptor [Pedobacter nyackensis]
MKNKFIRNRAQWFFSAQGLMFVLNCVHRLLLDVKIKFDRSLEPAFEPLGNYRTILNTMKFTTLILFLGFVNVQANSRAQTVTLSGSNMSLKHVFTQVKKQTGYVVFTNKKLLDQAKPVTLNVYNMPIRDFLNVTLKNQSILYEITHNTISLSKEPGLPEAGNGNRSDLTIVKDTVVYGSVRDSIGNPLVAASVTIKGKANRGTSTDRGGRFQIVTTSPNDVLVVTYTGYKTIEEPIRNRERIDVVLREDENMLDMVTVAFGVQKKLSVIGAVSDIKPAELKLPVRSLTTAIGGRVPGVVSVQRSGEPGTDNTDIWIRGISTLSAGRSMPLILVDGVPRSFSNLDPEDIESFSILKDAAATALYGVRGANGVVVITTKSGKAGKTNFNVRYNEGITTFVDRPKLVGGVEFMHLVNEALTTDGKEPKYSPEIIEKTRDGSDPYLYPNVSWFDEIFKDNGNVRSFNANISGGGDRSTFYVGLGYFEEAGLYKTDELAKYDFNTKSKRYNLTSNMEFKVTNSTEVKLGIQGFLFNVNYPGVSQTDLFSAAYQRIPVDFPVKYPGGEIADRAPSWLSNPYALLTQTGYSNQWENRLMSNLRITQDLSSLVKGLKATGMYSFDAFNFYKANRRKSPDTYIATGRDANGELILSQSFIGSRFLNYNKENSGSRQFYGEVALNYSRNFGDHDVTGLLLYNQSDNINTQASDLITSLPYRFVGYAGRTTYAYKSKYLLEGNFGYNGSENFAPDKQYGFFPSVGLGWVASEEGFFKSIKKVVNFMKIRATYGLVGNSDLGGRRFAYIATVNDGVPGYNFGSTSNNSFGGKAEGDIAVNVGWETSRKANLGIELKFLGEKLSLQTDVFKEERDGIFLARSGIPAYVGINQDPYGNVGKVNNKGFESQLAYNDRFGKLDVQLFGNFSFNRNEVIENDRPAPFPWQGTKGRRGDQQFGYISLGLFESYEEIANSAQQPGIVRPGDIKFKDMNGDGKINDQDISAIGYGQIPEIMYGFGFTLNYNAFSLSTLFQGAGNVNAIVSGEAVLPFSNNITNGTMLANIWDRWSLENPNPNAFYPRLSEGRINSNFEPSTFWMKDVSYVRLKTLMLAYNLPKKWIESIKVKGANIFFSGVNLFTISSFKLWDVEKGNGRGDSYPNLRTYSVGFNVNF